MRRPHLTGRRSSILYFLLIYVIFWFSADVVFTYVLPVVIEQRVDDLTVLGLIVSLGSLSAIAIDLLVGWKLAKKHSGFFFVSGFIVAFLLFFLTIDITLAGIILMVIFSGAAYKLFFFGTSDFIAHEVDYHDHGKASGFVELAVTFGGLTMPILVDHWLETINFPAIFSLYVLLIALAALVYILFRPRSKHKKVESKLKKFTLLKEFKVWRLLSSKILMLLISALMLDFIDSFFWTIGALFVIEYTDPSELSSFFLPAYMLPGVLVTMAMRRIGNKVSKEKLVFLTLGLGGILLSLFLFFDNVPLFILLTAASSFFLTLSYTLNDTIFVDFSTRLGEASNYVVGLRGLSSDIAYLAGPVIAGIVATAVGIKNSFAFAGILAAILGFMFLFLHPHKIRLPQKELQLIEDE